MRKKIIKGLGLAAAFGLTMFAIVLAMSSSTTTTQAVAGHPTPTPTPTPNPHPAVDLEVVADHSEYWNICDAAKVTVLLAEETWTPRTVAIEVTRAGDTGADSWPWAYGEVKFTNGANHVTWTTPALNMTPFNWPKEVFTITAILGPPPKPVGVGHTRVPHPKNHGTVRVHTDITVKQVPFWKWQYCKCTDTNSCP